MDGKTLHEKAQEFALTLPFLNRPGLLARVRCVHG